MAKTRVTYQEKTVTFTDYNNNGSVKESRIINRPQMELYPKFIIFEGNLIISKVKYHKDILGNTFNLETDKHKVKGGGWFTFNNTTNTFTFSKDSQDFGRASLEDVKKAVDEGRVFTNVYLTNNIADIHNFAYNTECEIIPLKTLETKL